MTITQNHIAEFSALVVSLVFWPKINKGRLRSLPLFLFFILGVELLGNYLHGFKGYNNVLYNFSIPIEYLFYMLLFYLHGDFLLRRFSQVACLSIIVIAIYNFVTKPFFEHHNYVLMTGQLSAILCGCIYFYERFASNEETSLIKIYFFWIASGLLLFNLGELAYSIYFNAFKTNKKLDPSDLFFKYINNTLLLFLYFFYIVAIIINKKPVNKNARDY